MITFYTPPKIQLYLSRLGKNQFGFLSFLGMGVEGRGAKSETLELQIVPSLSKQLIPFFGSGFVSVIFGPFYFLSGSC